MVKSPSISDGFKSVAYRLRLVVWRSAYFSLTGVLLEGPAQGRDRSTNYGQRQREGRSLKGRGEYTVPTRLLMVKVSRDQYLVHFTLHDRIPRNESYLLEALEVTDKHRN